MVMVAVLEGWDRGVSTVLTPSPDAPFWLSSALLLPSSWSSDVAASTSDWVVGFLRTATAVATAAATGSLSKLGVVGAGAGAGAGVGEGAAAVAEAPFCRRCVIKEAPKTAKSGQKMYR